MLGRPRVFLPYFCRMPCPVRAVARRIIYLRNHLELPNNPPLHLWHSSGGAPHNVSSLAAAQLIRQAIFDIGEQCGTIPDHCTARSLRSSGAMALLTAKVDHDTIKLLGRWRSDTMIRYLHVQNGPVMAQHAQNMLQRGSFTFSPHSL